MLQGISLEKKGGEGEGEREKKKIERRKNTG